jgi:NAD(P)-dependent dehydrogenase (short-subunit alcohol dehydrogenase family)
MDRTVAVTGGSKLGRAVVAALIEEGWTVVNSDRVPSPDSQPTSYARTSPTTARARGDQIAVVDGVVAAVGHTDASYDQTHAGTSAGVQPRDRSCPGAGRPESPPATRRTSWCSTPP